MKVATHVVFAECCWFATSAVFDVQYAIPEVLAVGAASLIPDADYPESWLGYRLGRVSKDLNRLFGHRSFLHSLLALILVVTVLGLPMWWIAGNLAPVAAIFVGYGSHLVADMMSVGGVQIFWPNRAIAVFPGRDDYRVVPGSSSERVFVIVLFVLALLFYPVSRVGFDGLIYLLGGADHRPQPFDQLVDRRVQHRMVLGWGLGRARRLVRVLKFIVGEVEGAHGDSFRWRRRPAFRGPFA